MAIADSKRISETIRSFEGGVDSGVAPLLINRNQVSWAINATQRGGFIGCRPGIHRRNIDFEAIGDGSDFSTAYFQGCGSFTAENGTAYLMVASGGRIWSIDLNNGYELAEVVWYDGYVIVALPWTAPAVGANVAITLNSGAEIEQQYVAGNGFVIDGDNYELVSVSGNVVTFKNLTDVPGSAHLAGSQVLQPGSPIYKHGQLSPTAPHVWFCQAENQLVVQDGTSRPVIWDGLTARTAADDEVPVGGPMAYGRGRLWVARGSLYFGGDLVWSHPALARASVIKFTENTFLAEGGAFAVPGGPITGLSFAANLDTSLGEGDLLVFTADAVFAFQAPIDRTLWASLTYPIQRFALLDLGSLNHEGIARMNGDLFFRSDSGYSSLIYARRDFGMWGNSPISREVTRAMEKDSRSLLYAGSAVTFDNRYLATVNPRWNADHGVWHGGLVALNFDMVSRMSGKTQPAWEGVWTGIQFLQLVKQTVSKVERCFAFALVSNEISLWEITRKERFDFDLEHDTRIEWVLETGSFTGGNPDPIKRLLTADMWFANVAGQVNITAKYRSERSEKWNPWATQAFCVQYRDCTDATPPACQTPVTYREAGKSRIGLPQPPDKNDPIQGGLKREAYEFQLRLEITGHCELRRLRCSLQALDEDQYGDLSGAGCLEDVDEDCQEGCLESEWCDPSDWEYQV